MNRLCGLSAVCTELERRVLAADCERDRQTVAALLPILPFDAQLIRRCLARANLSAAVGIDLLLPLSQVQVDVLGVRHRPMDVGAFSLVDVRAVGPEADLTGAGLDLDLDITGLLLIVPTDGTQPVVGGLAGADLCTGVGRNTTFLLAIADVDCLGVVHVPTQHSAVTILDGGAIGAEIDVDSRTLDVDSSTAVRRVDCCSR